MTEAGKRDTPAETVVVKCGRLIDGTGGPPREQVSLVIQGGIIQRVLPGVQDTSDASTAIDATDATVLPGLMDLHVHLACITDPGESHTAIPEASASSPMLALHAARNARVFLAAGFTTVRDMAGTTTHRNAEVLALRRAVEIGLVPGPRVFAAGWAGQTAGHNDTALPPALARRAEDYADGPWAVRRQVREMVRDGVDLIKTSAKGHYTFEEMAAMADEAHAFGRRVAVHSKAVSETKASLRAGFDTIEHGTELDDEAIAMLLDRGTVVVPTLSGRGHAVRDRIRRGASAADIGEHRKELDAALETAGRAHRAGVKIACGTDSYRSIRAHWGECAFELEMLVQAGFSPMEAIVAATKVGAEALGQEKRLGTLEAGKCADLLVFEGDPLSDIRQLQELERIRLVVKGGRTVVDRRDARRNNPQVSV